MKLSASKRDKLPSSSFAGPDRSYPVHDKPHARMALAMVSKYGSPEEQRRVKAKVKARYPDIEQGSGILTPLGQRTLAGFEEKWGPDEGHQKFEEAMQRGTIDRSKMEVPGTDTGARSQPQDNDPIARAARTGRMAGVDTVQGENTKPNPTKPGTRKVPTGLARAAAGHFQSRPG